MLCWCWPADRRSEVVSHRAAEHTSSRISRTATESIVGDEVRILGVPVGKIETIEPQPQRAKITFWIDAKYQIPADAKAVDPVAETWSPSRAIQLTPAYTGGPALPDDAVIPKERTAVPVEFDDLRQQLEKLTDRLQAHPARRRQCTLARSSTPPPTTCAGRALTSVTR